MSDITSQLSFTQEFRDLATQWEKKNQLFTAGELREAAHRIETLQKTNAALEAQLDAAQGVVRAAETLVRHTDSSTGIKLISYANQGDIDQLSIALSAAQAAGLGSK